MAIRRTSIPKSQSALEQISQQYRNGSSAQRQYQKTHGGTFVQPGRPVNLGIVRNNPQYKLNNQGAQGPTGYYQGRPQVRVVNSDGVASAGVGILGAASLTNPSLLPFAAAAGVGYGVYKLGESFNLW